MKQMGYEVLTACNGEEAVALFEANADRVRVVLLDLMMPVMDGAEALAAIRDQSTVPVILCSGYTSEAVPEELAGDTATGFLQKPYARGDLQSMTQPSPVLLCQFAIPSTSTNRLFRRCAAFPKRAMPALVQLWAMTRPAEVSEHTRSPVVSFPQRSSHPRPSQPPDPGKQA